MTMSSNRHSDFLTEAVPRVLIWGVTSSFVILVIGLILAAVLHGPTDYAVPLPGLWAGLRAWQPAAFLSLGLIVLMLTPLLRVVTAVIGFALEEDKIFTAVSLGVLLILLFSFYLGIG